MRNIMVRMTEGEQALLKRAKRMVHAAGVIERSRERFDRTRKRKTLNRLVRAEEAAR